jgi:DNA-binding NarL/FixJ family response regulator
MFKIALLENYTLFCSGIRPVLEKAGGFDVVVEARYLKEFLPALKENKPDLIIIDVIHSENEGVSIVKKIRAKTLKTPVLLVINTDHSEYLDQYIAMGVNGLVLNTFGPEQLIEAVNKIKEGSDYFPPKIWMLLKEYLRTKRKDIVPHTKSKSLLTDRELDILRLFCKGYTYKEIAHKLNISPRTVETHKKNITSKLNVRSTAEMVEFAVQNKLT